MAKNQIQQVADGQEIKDAILAEVEKAGKPVKMTKGMKQAERLLLISFGDPLLASIEVGRFGASEYTEQDDKAVLRADAVARQRELIAKRLKDWEGKEKELIAAHDEAKKLTEAIPSQESASH